MALALVGWRQHTGDFMVRCAPPLQKSFRLSIQENHGKVLVAYETRIGRDPNIYIDLYIYILIVKPLQSRKIKEGMVVNQFASEL